MALAVLLVLTSLIGLLFFPARIEVRRSIVILLPPEKVYDYVADLSLFNTWSPWYVKDTTADYEQDGPASGVGATLSWKSDHDEVGTGSMRNVACKRPERIEQELHFMENGVAKGEYVFSPVTDGTELTWTLSFDAGYNPLLRILGRLMNDKAGTDFEQGLERLKVQLESQAAPPAELTVDQVQLPVTYYLSTRSRSDALKGRIVITDGFTKVRASVVKQGLTQAGSPFVIYHPQSSAMDLEMAIPVGSPGASSGDVLAGELKSGKALMVRYFGPYERTALAHEAISQFMKDRQLVVTGNPWESYVIGPTEEKDTARWETDVYYPIR